MLTRTRLDPVHEELLAEALGGVLPEGAAASFYAIDGAFGRDFLFLEPVQAATGFYRDVFLGWVIVSRPGEDLLFSFKITGDELRAPAGAAVERFREAMRYVAVRVRQYLEGRGPEAYEMGEGGMLPTAGAVARWVKG